MKIFYYYNSSNNPNGLHCKNARTEIIDTIKLGSMLLFTIFMLFNTNFAFASDLKLKDTWHYSIDYNNKTIKITGGKISNKSDYTSGTIKLAVFINRISSNDGKGYYLAEYKLEPLEGGYYYYDTKRTLDFQVVPPNGEYFIKLYLLEYTEDGYVSRDYLKFSGYLTFNNKNNNESNLQNQQFLQKLYEYQILLQQQLNNLNPQSNNYNGYSNQRIDSRISELEFNIQEAEKSLSLYEEVGREHYSLSNTMLQKSTRDLIKTYKNQLYQLRMKK